jgi:hypothetical protein
MKNKFIYFIRIILAFLLILITYVCFLTSCSTSLSVNQIYNQSIENVVEIRTTNDNIDYAYASGCFISKNKIITNKHVIYNTIAAQNWTHVEYRKNNEEKYTEVSIEKTYTNVV